MLSSVFPAEMGTIGENRKPLVEQEEKDQKTTTASWMLMQSISKLLLFDKDLEGWE